MVYVLFFMYVCDLLVHSNQSHPEMREISFAIRQHMSRAPSNTFHPHDFSDIISFILYGTMHRGGYLNYAVRAMKLFFFLQCLKAIDTASIRPLC